MFLEVTKRRNPSLIKTGAQFHQDGLILPNTYMIDMDVVGENARSLSNRAKAHDIELFFMTKQLGRLPRLARWIADNGIEQAVAVEWEEAKILHDAGVGIGNVGHLVQPGKCQWKETLQMQPSLITVFSLERARQVSSAAKKLGVVQPVLLRVIDGGDDLYPGQEGGFCLGELASILPQLVSLPGVCVEGVTSFPSLRMNAGDTGFEFSPNVRTLLEAKKQMEAHGIEVRHVNAPGATSCHTIPMLKEAGATQGEPGHALTGTTPLHAVQDLEERPGMIYVTEVSHEDQKHAYVIGGGFYTRGNMTGALVGNEPQKLMGQKLTAKRQDPNYIDYYGALYKDGDVHVGDTAIYAFRTQIFVTRAHVALVRGIQEGKPELVHLQRRW
ncbi:YhfX family PLP-dependent enzyme [Salicibibacter halophilus]|uniref:YhfX family PLP-dependent enzyme n=1 Tax=Salicibibacter halophilus TaxID=2502791 RepID=A0A514LEW4_9BACI|nr:YhfX family PLP-dependent enzyme [Salicibibacter halophilus]QDI90396.1 YhfX family PLP-dependent enzyme [Salicibibacter halophilus]